MNRSVVPVTMVKDFVRDMCGSTTVQITSLAPLDPHTQNYMNDDERRFKLLGSHQLTQTDYTMLENAIFLIATKYPK